MPALFVILPNDGFDDTELRDNEDKTVIPYDINKLLIKWAGVESSDIKGKDIFNFISEKRTCDEYGVREDWGCPS